MADSLASRAERAIDREGGIVPRASSTRMSDITPRAIQWLWPSRIALGKLTLIAGDPGLGKSMLTANMAAHVTTGRPWPDGSDCPLGSVILVSGEDDPADTIRPRLDVAGADVNRVHLLEAVKESGRMRGFNLADIIPLAGLLDDIEDCKLILIDPVSAYLNGTDSHKNADIRALLTPLSQMAADRRVSITAVSHLNKSQAGNALSRVTGSLAFVAAARAAYIVARDPDEQAKRLFLPIKNNLGNDRTGLSYRIAEENGIPYVTWDHEPVSMSADEALAPMVVNETQRASKADAADFLTDVLATVPVKVEELKDQAKQAGLSWATVRRAKDALGVKAKRQGFGSGGEWFWFMPLASKMLTRADKNLSAYGEGEHLCNHIDAQEDIDAHVCNGEEVSTYAECTAADYARNSRGE